MAGQSGSHQKWRNARDAKQVIVARPSRLRAAVGYDEIDVEGSGIALPQWKR